jgi:hypothetical protein
MACRKWWFETNRLIFEAQNAGWPILLIEVGQLTEESGIILRAIES